MRFTIDYRRLNECINADRWPIPNIKQLLENLGQKRPEFFAVLDLTKGYYQAPLSVKSRAFTAFVTPDGTYEWTRCPMGLKNAGSYFQRSLCTHVLKELLHSKCELYIDDLIIFGATKEEYLSNLDEVLQRLSLIHI